MQVSFFSQYTSIWFEVEFLYHISARLEILFYYYFFHIIIIHTFSKIHNFYLPFIRNYFVELITYNLSKKKKIPCLTNDYKPFIIGQIII